MPVDIKALRESPEQFRDSERRRFRDPARVDAVLEADESWRAETSQLNSLRAELSKVQAGIAKKKKTSKGTDPCAEELAEKECLDAAVAATQEALAAADRARSERLAVLGNLLHLSVPTSASEDDNVVVRSWGETSQGGPVPPHWEVLKSLGACEMERGVRVAGRRGYFLRGEGVLLNMALQNYGVSFLVQRGYVPLQPPYFMRKEVMARTAELADFDEQLYKVSSGRGPPTASCGAGAAAGGGEAAAGEGGAGDAAEAYLIATSEQPISALHQDESLKPSDLPIRYAGVSPCFRAETGSHGLDAKGLFRVHQFEKVEQFCICAPEESWELFEGMMSLVEEFYQSLGLSYRIVEIASGALNSTAAKKYDLEAWFPSIQEYRELVSCSNCTDFQARALNIRLDEGKGSRFVHMLNATLCATERTLCCLVENFQEEGGVRVPRVLVPYMQGRDFLRFTA
eukprot:CAMPEP_0203854594 /NCGR_PEP_ID=MMETSP0359-20131031/9182_1 /ASSEMBLY_ACC=CAM_ASM_000338 /TAXON_ID=268821 /ORGANISM="Scrippsiella Hangoei, Strain SHTV-5" /LENGTH=456 /DNA_ID=CAMNT_0050771081 /DNA_START=69 /DNA_END=1436 /DNA_ORIENTATION=-